MTYLDRVNSPADVKKMTAEELKGLAADIREGKAGNTTTVSDAVYQKLEYALEGCHTILGEKYDTAGSPPAGSAA